MNVQIEGNDVVIRIPIERCSSKTGKSLTIASSHGCVKTDVEIDGKQLVVGVNCYIPKDKK